MTQQVLAFWRPTDQHACFGQWYESQFTFTQKICDDFPDGIKDLNLYKERYDVLRMLMKQKIFNTAEKFMMMGKAALFRDSDTFKLMADTDSPKEQKRIGRLVRDFDENTWNTYCKDIVKIGNYLKFTQDENLLNYIKNTDNAILVEGSPIDKIWGVGLRFDDVDINNPALWKGTNYLGECLMFVRDVVADN